MLFSLLYISFSHRYVASTITEEYYFDVTSAPAHVSQFVNFTFSVLQFIMKPLLFRDRVWPSLNSRSRHHRPNSHMWPQHEPSPTSPSPFVGRTFWWENTLYSAALFWMSRSRAGCKYYRRNYEPKKQRIFRLTIIRTGINIVEVLHDHWLTGSSQLAFIDAAFI